MTCDQVWRTDITYLETAEGWLYLAVVIDAHSRRIMGCAFSASLATDFAIVALQMAILRRGGKCASGLILHSDRGVQYASERFRAQLAAHDILASMSRRGNCYGNAQNESFFSTLKIELVYPKKENEKESQAGVNEVRAGRWKRQRPRFALTLRVSPQITVQVPPTRR
ncbi:transposase InsO family protein, partial [Ereboglobus sp. PH5-5]|uniref:DDE-type integrase/transposase/recombinase n=1 Tax=Ereboglobus sp. PH5-5 TaxID=2940529 RepID=UPI0024076972